MIRAIGGRLAASVETRYREGEMGSRNRTFSTFDGWMIDIFASIGAATVVLLTLLAIHKAIWATHPESDPGGAVLALALISLFIILVRLRMVREKRDARADQEEAAEEPPARARRGGR
jgi:hypothetical protein